MKVNGTDGCQRQQKWFDTTSQVCYLEDVCIILPAVAESAECAGLVA